MKTAFLLLGILLLLATLNAKAGLPPTSLKGQSGAKATTFNFEVPNQQATKTSTGGLIETGNANLLINPGFEHSTVGTGWTSAVTSTALATITAHTATPLGGLKSLSYSCDGGASGGTCTLYQDATTAHSLQGMVKAIIKSDSATGVKLFSRVNGVNNLSRDIISTSAGSVEIPQVLGTTSTGIALEITVAASEVITVLIDSAFVGAQDVKQDVSACNSIECETEFSAKVSSTDVVSGENIDWINGNCTNASTGRADCVPISGTFSETPNCSCSLSGAAGECTYNQELSTPSLLVFFTVNESGVNTNSNFTAICQRSGSDFTKAKRLAGGSIYSTASPNTDWKSCGHTTSDFTGFGTVTNIQTQCKRQGSDLLMRIKFTSGAPTAVEARLTLKFEGQTLTSADTNTIASIQSAAIGAGALSFITASVFNPLIEPSTTYMTFGFQNSVRSGLTKLNGNDAFSNGNTVSLGARIPIAGWEDSHVIVGDFKEMVKVPGVTRPKTCIVSFGGSGSASAPTACTTGTCVEYEDNCGTATSVFNGTGDYTTTFANETFANSSGFFCSCMQTATGLGCAPGGGGSNFVTSSLGGLTVRVRNTIISGGSVGTQTNGAIKILCTGEAP